MRLCVALCVAVYQPDNPGTVACTAAYMQPIGAVQTCTPA